MHVGQKLVSKFYTFKIGRWVFSSTLDLNQTTAKETTSSPFIFYYIGISKPHSLFIPCHHPFAGCVFSSFPRFLPFFNVFAKGRLRSESRQEDHVIRLWYYVCTNCISTKKKGSRKKATNNLVFHAPISYKTPIFFFVYFTENQMVNEGLGKYKKYHTGRRDWVELNSDLNYDFRIRIKK